MSKRTSNRNRIAAILKNEREITGSEEGRALNVEGFIGQALDHLKAGNYEGFLTCADLAGEFAKQARDELYCRRQRIERADRAARLAEFGCQPIGNVRPIDSNTMYSAVQRIERAASNRAVMKRLSDGIRADYEQRERLMDAQERIYNDSMAGR